MGVCSRGIYQGSDRVGVVRHWRSDNRDNYKGNTLPIVVASEAVLTASLHARARDGEDLVKHHRTRNTVQVVAAGAALAQTTQCDGALYAGAVDANEAQTADDATRWTPDLARCQNKGTKLTQGCGPAGGGVDAIGRLILANIAGAAHRNARHANAAKHVVSAHAPRGAESWRDVFLLCSESAIGDGAGLTHGVGAGGASLQQLSKGADKGRAKLALALWVDGPRDTHVAIGNANVRGGGPDLPRKRRGSLTGNAGLERAPRIAHLPPLACSSFH